jgi:hypothetical protein
MVVNAVPRAPSAFIFGIDPNGFVARRMVFTAGHGVHKGEADVGDLLAASLHARIGGKIKLGGRMFALAAVFHSGVPFEDQGVITTLADAQILAGRPPDEATTIAVRLEPQVSVATAERKLQKAFRGVSAISDPTEAIRASANTELISKAVLLIVVLALIIGALAVANTMLAAVLERRRELVLLSTIGWSPSQLAGLVLGEAVAVSIIGTFAGLLLGWLASGLLPQALGLQAFISPEITIWGLRARRCGDQAPLDRLGRPRLAEGTALRCTRGWSSASSSGRPSRRMGRSRTGRMETRTDQTRSNRGGLYSIIDCGGCGVVPARRWRVGEPWRHEFDDPVAARNPVLSDRRPGRG